MKPSERQYMNIHQLREDNHNWVAADGEDVWFFRPHGMTQEEERSFLKYMSNDMDNDPDQQLSQAESEGVAPQLRLI